MSRRKQANPKPAKRDSDLEELAALVQLPTDLFYLKEVDEENCPPYAIFAKVDLDKGKIIGNYKGEFLLEKSDEDVTNDVGSCFKVNRANGCKPVHVMLENGGQWLKLMRSATKPDDANICLRISGPDIVCRVTQHVIRGVELRVTCVLADQESADQTPDSSSCLDVELNGNGEEQTGESNDSLLTFDRKAGMVDTTAEEADSDGMVAVKSDANPGDSNSDNCEEEEEIAKTVDADETGRLDGLVSPSSDNQSSASNMSSKDIGVKDDYKGSHSIPFSPISDMADSMPNVVPGSDCKPCAQRVYKCPFCTYQCNREHYLVKHMKVHDTLSAKDSVLPHDQSSFCEECNIQFMSAKTYQVHKEIYCKARHEMNDMRQSLPRTAQETTANPSSEDVFVVRKNSLNGMPPVIQPQGFFAAISTDPLILLPCSLVNGQGLLPQNGIITTGAPIVLPAGITGSAVIENNGISLHPRTKNTNDIESNVASHAKTVKDPKIPIPVAPKYATEETDVLDLKKSHTPEARDTTCKSEMDTCLQDAPLDLTVRKRKMSFVGSVGQHSTGKRRNSSASTVPKTPPSQFSVTNCSSPEPTNLHVSTRGTISPPSFSNDASSSSGMGPLLPLASLPINGVHSLCKMPDRESPGPPVLISTLENTPGVQPSVIPIGLPPPKLLKQGNNRCENCNIVFYKYDNYLAHKKHYCAYRRRQPTSASESLSATSDLSHTDDSSNNQEGHEHMPKKLVSAGDKSPKCGTQLSSVDYGQENVISSPSVFVHKTSSVYRCDSCGVKFSTADNLNAHQTYYCSRKMDNTYPKYNVQVTKRTSKSRETPCQRCGETSVEGHDEICCPEEWKCNFCEVVCPSLKSARRHLLTHSEMRGFCCIICGYRGNTLRGMRTHVYEHLNGNSSQIEDILASSIMVDAGATNNASCYRGMDCSDEETTSFHDGSKLVVDESSRDVDSNVIRHLSSKGSPSSRTSRERDSCSEHSGSEDCRKSPLRQSLSNESADTAQTNKHINRTTDDEHSESGYARTLNPGALCDVVIKTEDEDSIEKIVPERVTPSPAGATTIIKEDPDSLEEEIDVERTDVDKEDARTQLGAVTSVICRVSSQSSKSNSDEEGKSSMKSHKSIVPKKRTRSHTQPKSELKYCKSCDIAFHHLSNFIAHKKYYCVSRVIENFQQETAPVQ